MAIPFHRIKPYFLDLQKYRSSVGGASAIVTCIQHFTPRGTLAHHWPPSPYRTGVDHHLIGQVWVYFRHFTRVTGFRDGTVIYSGYAGPPSPSQLSDEAYKAECQKKIAAGKYPLNFDCSQRLHTEAGMADSILELSQATPAARDPIFDVTAQLVSSEVKEMLNLKIGSTDVVTINGDKSRAVLQEPNVKGKYIFVPTAPASHQWVKESLITEGCSDSEDLANWGVSESENPDLANLCKSGSPFCNPNSCLKHVLVLGEEDVSVDGSNCDRPGVSLEQWGRDGFCDYKAGSCFAKNLKWFHEYNKSAIHYPSGNYPRYYAESNNASEAIDVSKAGAFQLQRLAFVFPGSVDATFYLELPYCTEHGSSEPTDKLDPVPAVRRTVAAGSSQAFDLTLRLMAVVEQFDFNCIMKLYDSELNQLDVKTFDLLTGKANDLPGAVTNPTGEVTVVDPPVDTRNWYQRLMNVVPNDGECDCSFWNFFCLPADCKAFA
ncbi:hypothetical protein ACSSS7_000436 [Eimeria intestinalis]